MRERGAIAADGVEGLSPHRHRGVHERRRHREGHSRSLGIGSRDIASRQIAEPSSSMKATAPPTRPTPGVLGPDRQAGVPADVAGRCRRHRVARSAAQRALGDGPVQRNCNPGVLLAVHLDAPVAWMRIPARISGDESVEPSSITISSKSRQSLGGARCRLQPRDTAPRRGRS